MGNAESTGTEVKDRQRGYLLLEMLAMIFVMLTVMGGIFLEGRSLEKVYYKQQIRLAAQQLAGDLRRLQRDAAYFSISYLDVVRPDGYQISRNALVRESYLFKNYGCDGVYFRAHLYSLSFSTDGVPRSSGSYVLGHKKLPDCRYFVEVQPVSGRVLVYEKK